MKLIKQLVAITALAFPVAAFAHGGGEHLMGTVKAVDDKGLTIETKEKDVKVAFDEKTRFEKDGAASSAKELSPGARVVVHTGKKKGATGPVAVLVKFSGKNAPTQRGWRSARGDRPRGDHIDMRAGRSCTKTIAPSGNCVP